MAASANIKINFHVHQETLHSTGL